MEKILYRLFDSKGVSLKIFVTSVCLCIMLIPFAVISTFLFSTMNGNYFDGASKDMGNYIQQSTKLISSYFGDAKEMYYTLISDPIINSEMYIEINEIEIDDEVLVESVVSRLRRLLNYNSSWNSKIIKCIYILPENGYEYYLDNFFTSNKPTTDAINSSKDIDGFMSVFNEIQEEGRRIDEILFSNNGVDDIVYFAKDYYKVLNYGLDGIIVIGINTDKIAESFSGIEKYEESFGLVYDEGGNIISTTIKGIKPGDSIYNTQINNKSLYEIINDDKNYYIEKEKINDFNINTAVIIPKYSIYGHIVHKMLVYIVLIILMAIFIAWFGFFVSKKSISYINSVKLNMEKMQNGKYDIILKKYHITELDKLNSIIEETSNKIGKLINEVYAGEILLKDAQLKALYAQINPHFLVNTLLCISCNAKLNNDENTYKMINALSDFLGAYMYGDGKNVISIENEIKNIKLYLYLQKIRFGDKIEYDFEIRDEVKNVLIPKLCIQPIVENAVIHGIENKIGKGKVTIKALKKENDVYLTIEDDGIGMEETDNIKPKGHGIALENIQKRLEYIYGQQYGITISSKKGEGTVVIIKLPMSLGEKDV